MKKLVFAVQVIGLIAMFPILVVLEMNHPTHNLIEDKSPSGVTKKADNIITQSAGKLKTQNEQAIPDLPDNMMLLKGY